MHGIDTPLKRKHMSLNIDELETPEKTFYRKVQDIILGNFLRSMDNIQDDEINDSLSTN